MDGDGSITIGIEGGSLAIEALRASRVQSEQGQGGGGSRGGRKLRGGSKIAP